MSMTELYALAIVAEVGLYVGCEEENIATNTGRNSACSSAIELVGSSSNMIVEMWCNPEEERHDLTAVRISTGIMDHALYTAYNAS